MRARSVTVAGVLSLATAVNAVGKAVINNHCGHDVYLWPTSSDDHPTGPTIIKANGGSWSQTYKMCSSGGMSLKLAKEATQANGITQFEYTLEPGTIWYDISNVDCFPFGHGLCPFQSTGMHLKSGSGCPAAKCAAGSATCHDAYTYPKDDWASLSCQPSADTVLDLCAVDGVIGQVTSLVGNLLGAGSESKPTPYKAPAPAPAPSSPYVAPPKPVTTSSPKPQPKPKPTPKPKAPVAHEAGVAYNNGGVVGIAAVPSDYEVPAPSPKAPEAPKPKTTLLTTQAPAQPNVAVVYETVTEMVATTTVVYSHKMAHKAKRDSAHPHARRHQHES